MRIAGFVALMAVAVPAAASAGTNSRDSDQPPQREAVCVRQPAQKAQRPVVEPRKAKLVARTDCRQQPAYPAVVDPLPIFIL